MFGLFVRVAASALSILSLSGMATGGQARDRDHVERVGADQRAPAGVIGSEGSGAVFAMTNATEDNQIVVYRRAENGRLTRVGNVSTRGNGIGVDLDTQGALQLGGGSNQHRYLYAANAGSDDVTVFAVNGTNLTFLQKVAAGDQPNSLTLSGNLLYVLNGSVAGNGIRGFKIGPNGTLTPLSNSVRLLSSPIAVPGIVQFSPDGRVLLVTHKVTNVLVPPRQIIDAFRIATDGRPSALPVRNRSQGLRPFALAFRNDGTVVVVEAFNAALGRSAVSSYDSSQNGNLAPISVSVPNTQTDGCWIVITNDGRYVYTANFGSGTISSYGLALNGELRLLDGQAASFGPLSQPVDLSSARTAASCTCC